LLELLCADSGFVFSPAIELRMNSVRIFKERPHIAPNRVFEKVRPNFLVAAKPIAVEAMGIAPDAAVVRIATSLPMRGGTARALPVESVAALDAGNEPLEEMGCPLRRSRATCRFSASVLDASNKSGLRYRDRNRGHSPDDNRR
jgi:hypothetical protein